MCYFVYSREQYKQQSKLAEKINKKYVPGQVYFKGRNKIYTEILSTPSSRFSDFEILVSIESLKDMKYSEAVFGTR